MTRQTLSRFELFKLATLFQGGVLLFGLIFAWIFEIHLGKVWTWSSDALLRGVLATIPMLIVFGVTELFDWDPFSRIRKFLNETLGPVITRCSLWELLYLALLAGISEEILFRGAIQNTLALWSVAGAVVITNLLFGVCHAFSRAYFFLATGAGFYLSWVAGWEQQNLFPAVLAHTLYDFMALLFIRWEVSREPGDSLAKESQSEAKTTPSSVDESAMDLTDGQSADAPVPISRSPASENGEGGGHG